MNRWLLSGTSTLALLLLGGGRAVAVPIAPVTGGVLSETVDQSDVVRQSLAVGAQTSTEGRTAATPDEPSLARPTIADVRAQTPNATFTWRPAVAVRGDTGLVGSLAAGGPRNRGNGSNLTGTIGGDSGGIFAVPASAIAINGVVEHDSDYLFRPVGTLAPLPASTELVPPEAGRDHPAHSVFIGIPPAFGDVAAERAAREASIVSAAGSATPTVRITPLPGQPAASGRLAYQVDAGLTTTIGFSTANLSPTDLPFGAAATSTLGYTYRPLAANPPPAIAKADEQTLSATITAPDGTLARRVPPVSAPATPARPDPSVSRSTAAVLPTMPGAPDVVPVESFPLSGGTEGTRLVTLPLRFSGVLLEVARGDLSVSGAEENDTGSENPWLLYVLIAATVTVPLGLAILAHRLVRRAALRQLGEPQASP